MASCSGVKNLAQADVEIPETYVPGTVADSDSLTIADLQWWEFYSDSSLRRIISRTLENNRDLLKAAAKVEEMRRLYNIDKAGWLPELTAFANGNYETNNYGGSGVTKDPEYSLKAALNWEVNLWGAASWASRQGAAKYKASVEDLRAMRMTLVAEAAEAYFTLLALDNELAIVRQTLSTRNEALEQARLRFEGGLTSETVYQQAKVEYATTAALIPNLERKVSEARNAITLLMGEYPAEDIERGNLIINVMLPDAVPTGLPSTLLERRPDLRASEQTLAAAMANVGLTYANRFPNLRLGATFGLENDDMSHFLKSPFSYVVGSITGSVLDFGKKKNKYKAAIAAYDQARFDYEKCVMTAFTEVNNALVAYQKCHQASTLKASLRDAAGKYVQLAWLQYRGGPLNYIDVLDAQRRYFDAQIAVSNAIRDEYLALVYLYKALGGGWNYDTAP